MGGQSDHNMSYEMVNIDDQNGEDGYVKVKQNNGLGFVDSDSQED